MGCGGCRGCGDVGRRRDRRGRFLGGEVDNRSSESIQGSVLELSSYTERSFNLAPGARTDLKWDGWYHEYVYNLDGESPNVVRFQSRFPNRDYLSNDITITYFDGDDGVEHEIECGEPCYWP